MLKSLELRDVGPADHLEIDFAPRVNLITGDNGLGKSFLLDIAWWALTRNWGPHMALPATGKNVKPMIKFRFDSVSQEVSHPSYFDWESLSWPGKTGRPGQPGMVLYAQVDGSFSVFDPVRNYWKKDREHQQQSEYRFSAQQVWGGLSIPDPLDPTQAKWLCNGLLRDWAMWQTENGTAFQQFCSVLQQLSPRPDERLEPGALTKISDDARAMPTLKMPYGKSIPIVHASAAMRRVVALAYLLVWTWRAHKEASELRNNQKTTNSIIFLIDEIEAHLHPAWQRRILRALMDVMKALAASEDVAVQVITVTHSPMLLASMEPVFDPVKDALWLFDLVDAAGQKEVKLRRDDWHRRGDASAWLKSDIFDLGEARSVEAEEAMVAARSFMQRNVSDPPEFQRIYDLLRAAMPGDDPFWATWRGWAWRHGLLDEKTP